MTAAAVLRERHYTQSVPSGKSYYFLVDVALVVFSIPANHNIGKFLLWQGAKVWELSRLWAPDGHERNLLTYAIAGAVRELRKTEPGIDALVSYADPNVGHEGFVYKAASWLFTGQSEETRAYRGPHGEVMSRRAFHSGRSFPRKAEILEMGYTELRLPGKHRYVKGLTRRARRTLRSRFGE